MQLIANGPDIPAAVLHSQEEGKLVFFCGAGILYAFWPTEFQEAC